MNREQKTAFIEDVATSIGSAEAVFAVDYRGVNVAQIARLRESLRESDARFQVVKNTLTARALDSVGDDGLKQFLAGPTALTYVRGDVARAAKTLNQFATETDLLIFKGGQMSGAVVTPEQFKQLATLPTRDVLHARLVSMVAAPLTGLARTLGGLVQGLALQLGQIQERGLVGSVAALEQSAPAASEVPTEPAAADPAVNDEAPTPNPSDEAGSADATSEDAGPEGTESAETEPKDPAPEAAESEAHAPEDTEPEADGTTDTA